MALGRSLCVPILVCLCACPGDVPPRDEGEDAPVTTVDAPLVMPDAGAADARAADARTADARTADAKSVPDAPACTITGGKMGFCIDVTVCTSMPNHTATPGFCPGPANIQCCTAN